MHYNFQWPTFDRWDGCIEVTERKFKSIVEAHSDKVGIVAMGRSGVVVACPLAYKLRVPLMLLTRDDGAHMKNRAVYGLHNGDLEECKKWVFVDDFVDSGATKAWVESKVKECGNEIVGKIMYQGE